MRLPRRRPDILRTRHDHHRRIGGWDILAALTLATAAVLGWLAVSDPHTDTVRRALTDAYSAVPAPAPIGTGWAVQR